MSSEIGIFAYATATPIRFEMDIPTNSIRKGDPDKDLDQLWHEAVHYGGDSNRSAKVKGPSGEQTTKPGTKTTVATSRIPLSGKNLIGFKSKVNSLPQVYETSSAKRDGHKSGDVVNAERAVSEFKKYAALKLREAEAKGVSGYDECVKVLKDINTKAVKGIVKVEFYTKRVSVTPFIGGTQGKDGLYYETKKVRKFYLTVPPSVDLLEAIIKDYLASDEVVSYNEDWRFAKSDGTPDFRTNKISISMRRVGYETLSASDKALVDTLSKMRNRSST